MTPVLKTALSCRRSGDRTRIMTGKHVDTTPWNVGESPSALPGCASLISIGSCDALRTAQEWLEALSLQSPLRMCGSSMPMHFQGAAILVRAGDLRRLIRDPDGLVLDSKLRRDVLTCGELAQACYDSVEKEPSSFRRCWNIYSSKPEKIQDVSHVFPRRLHPAGVLRRV